METNGINNFLLNMIEQLMGQDATSTTDLKELGGLLLTDGFKGAFAADQIPKLKKNESCIVNLDGSDKPGSHWIALAKDIRRVIIYDSFGRKSSKILNKNVLKEIKKYIDTEYDAEQDVSESNCGQRCIAWLLLYELYGSKMALQL